MERHGHLQLDPVVRSRLLDVSAATIDRLLSPEREATGRMRRRRWGAGSTVRQSVPVRTFADWGDPPPGYFECDLVEHCGGVKEGAAFATAWHSDYRAPKGRRKTIAKHLIRAARM